MSTASQTQFVSTEFDTEVSDDDVHSLVNILDEAVSELRERIERDDAVEGLLKGGEGDYSLRGEMSVSNQDPEPLTQEVFIEPILEELGYSSLKSEVSGASPKRQNVADYSYRLDDDRIDSRQLLIEAEPLNKKLVGRGHGVDQVENWLRQFARFWNNFLT